MTLDEKWRDLKVGDKVRIVAWPPEMVRENLHANSQEFLDWLIDTQSILTITEIDEWGLPFGYIERWVNGCEQSEWWGLNHGEWEIVSGG